MTDELRKLAKAATPGPWQNAPDGYRVFNNLSGKFGMIKLICWTGANKKTRISENKRNADFIAAANPTVVLALLDEIDGLRAKVASLEAA